MNKGKIVAKLNYTPISAGNKPKMEFKAMTDQKGDQAALNGLMDDCYPDGWPWEPRDIATNKEGQGQGAVPLYIVRESDIRWMESINALGNPDTHYYPLAGTWVEGRLRELIGEAFYNLGRTRDGGYYCCYVTKKAVLGVDYARHKNTKEYPTPIQALVAALRTVLKQKEGDGV